MNQVKSHFRSELAIIPPVARGIAVVAFAIMQICLLGLLPHFVNRSEIPPMPFMVLISLVGGAVLGIIVLMVGYVYADSKRRGMNALLWTLLGIIGLMAGCLSPDSKRRGMNALLWRVLVVFVPKARGFIGSFLPRKPLL